MGKAKKVLVAGASGRRGRKVLEFLKNRGFLVFGADRVARDEDMKEAAKFFKLNLRHRDSIWLMFRVCRPDALVYCAVSEKNRENYSTYLGILLMAIDFGVKQVAVVTEKFPSKQHPKSLYEVGQLAIILATQALAREHKFEYRIITQEDNLLKEAKRFLKDEKIE